MNNQAVPTVSVRIVDDNSVSLFTTQTVLPYSATVQRKALLTLLEEPERSYRDNNVHIIHRSDGLVTIMFYPRTFKFVAQAMSGELNQALVDLGI